MDDSNINMVKISDDGIDEEYELDDLPALVYFRYNQFSIFFFYQIKSFKNGRVIRPNACCVFRPAYVYSECRLQGEINLFLRETQLFLPFSITNGKKGKLKNKRSCSNIDWKSSKNTFKCLIVDDWFKLLDLNSGIYTLAARA